MYPYANAFERMIEQIVREAEEARNTVRREKAPMMVKSLSVEDPSLDARVLHRRIIDGGRKAQRQFDEMFKALNRKPSRSATTPRTANRQHSLEDKARWLNGIIKRFDRSIAAGNLDSQQVATIENRIHHTARRMGLV